MCKISAKIIKLYGNWSSSKFIINEKCTKQNLYTMKLISCFMKYLWNCLHEILWEKSFTVYPCLMEIFKVVWRGKENNLQSEWNAKKKKNAIVNTFFFSTILKKISKWVRRSNFVLIIRLLRQVDGLFCEKTLIDNN